MMARIRILAGALVVGDSVRGSLRDVLLQQLGRTDRAEYRRADREHR